MPAECVEWASSWSLQETGFWYHHEGEPDQEKKGGGGGTVRKHGRSNEHENTRHMSGNLTPNKSDWRSVLLSSLKCSETSSGLQCLAD